MPRYDQIALFPELGQEDEIVLPPAGLEIDPAQIIDSVDKAIALFGREIGRIGTILNQLSDKTAIGHFSALYGQHITRYVDILLKKKTLDQEAGSDLERILEGVYQELNDNYNLAGTGQEL